MNSELVSPTQSIAQPPVVQPSNFLILLVDDVISNLRVLQSMFSQSGYRLTFASGGRQALERVQNSQPDLLLLDLMMPEFDGLQVAAAMKKNPQWADIPIIFLTASHELDHLLQAFESGAVDYLTKPFRVPELLARVKIHLELRHLRQQVQIQARNEAILRQIIEGIHQSLNISDILNGAVSDIQRFLDADRVMICRYRAPHHGQVMAIAQSESADSDYLADIMFGEASRSLPLAMPWIGEASRSLPLAMPWIGDRFGPYLTDSDEWTDSTSFSISIPSTASSAMLGSDFSSTQEPNMQVLRVTLPDEPPDSADHAAFLTAWEVKTELSLPIFLHNTLWGLLIIHHNQRSDVWRQGEADMLVQVAQQMAIAIQQAELHHGFCIANQHLSDTVAQLEKANHELDRLSHVDGLTQVPNRRFFDRYIQQEWLRMRREQQPLTLILCDIDYFKQFNDTYGHLDGDDALRIVAQTLAYTLKRPADLVARYGGEEFAAILPNTSRQGGEELAEQMRLAVLDLEIAHSASILSPPVLTISLGIASVVPSQATSIDTLFAAVDRALYLAKARGRNCCAIVHIDTPSRIKTH